MSVKKLILVIGATGVQGRTVISSLLAPQADGTPSPWSIRALTRDPTSERAQVLSSWGVELFKGRIDESLDSITPAFEGCYGVYVNIDSFTVGQRIEIYAGIKLYEQARRAHIKHFVWSGLDYASKLGNFDPKYRLAFHFDAKGIVGEFLRAQPSSPDGDSLTWSIISTGPYLENLFGPLLGPLPKRENGVLIWALPTGDGHIPLISLQDIGWWARYTFDHRLETSGQELKIATEMATAEQMVKTFTRVTGIPAIHKRMPIDEYLATYPGRFTRPMVSGEPDGYTIGDTYRGVYTLMGNDIVTRDMEWIRRVHPTGHTLESFIKEKGFDGTLNANFTLLNASHLHAETQSGK
ncbi:hypothetical protein F5051DRAFT_433778 [Lentinula edodes]|uniref:NmrA-like domain-containing protein n=1 Tax=Lentinula lateritia TaxID=40482 RepID=A0A9W9AZM8_9AGAR|nr:hypothetical protein F5051DRAFT_433778 [Lentinula edodes]KAJ3886193.1 hypothetical protein GG344DRAFT_57911 [Lentinula edodes]KAJ4493045.1 hypothetical protein C8J55DRAFT_418502 [Lentinula edodes]